MSRDFDDPRFERGYTRGYDSSYAPPAKPREPTPDEKAAWAGNVAKNLDNARSHVATCIEAMRSAHAARDVAAYQSARSGAEASIESLRELATAAKERAADAKEREVQAALANAETLVESARRDLDAAPPAPVPQPPTLGCATVLATALPPIENPAGPLQTVFATARHEVGRIFRDMPFSDFVAFEKLLRDFGSHELALRFRRFGASAQKELLGILNDPKERARARAREVAIGKPQPSSVAAVATEEHAPPAHADTPAPEPASALPPSNVAGVEHQQDAARTAVDEEHRIGTPDADHAPLIESLDHRLSSALDANDVETALDAVFGKLDAAERLAVANRLDAYRPMCGDMIAARIKRLDRTPRLVHVLNSLRDPGPRKLPDEIRGDLEHATGRSLDHVRVHAGADGASMADAHGARAVTIGPDIYMGAGQLDAQSGDGRELIAHEVAHTVQAETHPGPLAAAAKRDGGSVNAAEREADAFGSRFRSEGAAATCTPSVPVGGATPMRAPATAQAVDAARAREGFNAKLDNQLSIAARQDANISAPAYLHLHMAQARRGVHLFLASRAIASGDPHVEIRDSFFDALFAAFDGNDTAASVTRLRRWIAPADLYAVVDRNRPIIEIEKAQASHPGAALDYQHGPKGPAYWSEAVATAVGSALEPRLIESLARMSPRLVAVTARKREAAKVSGEAPAAVQPSELVCAHPLDWHVALAMVGRTTPGVEVKPGELPVSPEAQVTYRRISEIEWQGGHGGAWNALRVVTPHDANVEEVAFYIFGKSTEAYRIQRIGPYFVIPEDEAGRIPAAAVFRGIAGAGAHALAFGATAAAVETAEIERALARDRRDGHTQPPAAASATSLESQWVRIDEQLQGIALVVRPFGLDASLSGAMARHLAHKADIPTLSPQDAGMRGELFTRQSVLLTKIAAEVGSVASQADEQRARTASIAAVLKAIGATPTQDQATTTTLQRLVHAANLSHLPQTGEAAFAEAHTASRDTIADTLEAMLGQAATQIEIARLTMSRSQASSARSTRVFGASFQQRTDALRQRLAELRSKMLHGTAEPAEIQALYQAIDGLRVETGMVAQIGQLGQLFDVLDQLESSGWVLFSEALTAKIGETSDDNAIGRLETARRGAFELRSDLQTLHSQWLKVQKGATQLAAQLEAGGVGNAPDQANATVAPQLDAIRQKLANLGNKADVQAFLRDAYDKVDSAQTRTMIVQIATMIGIAVVSGGVAAMAEGVALGAGATAFGAQLAGLGVETTMFTLLSARLSGESIVHAFASNFAGNLVTFGAIRATNALVAGSAIGRTLAQAKAGERVSRLAAIAAKTAEISAPMLVAIGVQFAQAEAEMLLREGRTLTMEELTATGVQGIAMMIGAAVTHKVLGQSMNEAKAFGAEYGARRAQRAQLEKLAHEVMAQGDGSQTLDLLRDARAYVDAEVAKWQELKKLPANELEARGLSKPVVDTMSNNAQAHMSALDAMEAGTISAQLGLDTVVPGHVYAGASHAVNRVIEAYRVRGYKVEQTGDGMRLSRDGEAPLLIIERKPTTAESASRADAHRETSGSRAPAGREAESHAVETWGKAKAALMAGHAPDPGLLPATVGNEAGVRRLREIHADKNLPDEVRAMFLADLAEQVGRLEEPVADLHRLMRDITLKQPGTYLRKGKKMPSVEFVQNEMGGLRRALSLKWLLANATGDVYKRANELDPQIPPVKPAPKDAWGLAGKLVELLKSGRLPFDPTHEVSSNAMIGDFPPGASGWFFAGKDVPLGLPPAEMRVRLAVGPEYADGYQIAEIPPELAIPNEKGEGGASRPTALDLCLAPEGKLNPNQDEPAGRTDPAALQPGQADAREVVMPPIPLSATKRGPLVTQ